MDRTNRGSYYRDVFQRRSSLNSQSLPRDLARRKLAAEYGVNIPNSPLDTEHHSSYEDEPHRSDNRTRLVTQEQEILKYDDAVLTNKRHDTLCGSKTGVKSILGKTSSIRYKHTASDADESGVIFQDPDMISGGSINYGAEGDEDNDHLLYPDRTTIWGDHHRTIHNQNNDSYKRWNIARMVIGFTFISLSFSVFGDACDQYLYMRFEEEVLGANMSRSKHTTSKNPCLHSNSSGQPWVKELDEAQSRASDFNSYALAVCLGPAIFSNMLLSGTSDKKGRRMLFIVPSLGIVVRIAVACVVCYWHLDLNFMFIGYAVEGLTGSFIAFFLGIAIYTSDNTSSETSGRSYSMVVAQCLSYIISSSAHLGTGYFITTEGYFWPMVTSLGLAVCGLLCFVFFLRETVVKSDFNDCSDRAAAMKRVFGVYFVRDENSKHKRKDFIMIGVTFVLFGSAMTSSVNNLFLMNEPLCWSSEKIGYASAAKGMFSGVVAMCLIPLLQKVFSDEVVTLLSLLTGIGYYLTLAFSSTDWMIYVAYALAALEGAVLPMIRGLLSKMVPDSRHGSLFASIAVLEVATIGLSGTGVSLLYSATVAIWRGMAYSVVAGSILMSSLVMTSYIIMIRRRTPKVTWKHPVVTSSEEDYYSGRRRYPSRVDEDLLVP